LPRRHLHDELRRRLSKLDWIVDGERIGNMHDFYLKVSLTH
jgi:hypothetical protein